jgi:hypothetical protein
MGGRVWKEVPGSTVLGGKEARGEGICCWKLEYCRGYCAGGGREEAK